MTEPDLEKDRCPFCQRDASEVGLTHFAQERALRRLRGTITKKDREIAALKAALREYGFFQQRDDP